MQADDYPRRLAELVSKRNRVDSFLPSPPLPPSEQAFPPCSFYLEATTICLVIYIARSWTGALCETRLSALLSRCGRVCGSMSGLLSTLRSRSMNHRGLRGVRAESVSSNVQLQHVTSLGSGTPMR